MSEKPSLDLRLESPGPASYQILTVTRHEIEIVVADREYQVTGANLRKLNDFSVTLKLSAFAKSGEKKFFISDLNLARSKSRKDFVDEAEAFFMISPDILGEDLLLLIEALEKLQRENLARLDEEKAIVRKTFALKDDEEARAIEYLSKKDVLNECLLKDLEKLGYVGDEIGKKVLYLAATSRKFLHPVSVLSVANSSAGKSFAQEMILSLMPDDEVLTFTRLSPMSLSHFGRNDLRHKLINIDELSGIDPVEAMYQLRSLISRGSLTAGFTSIDRQTGRMETLHKEVLGPVAVMTSTTHEELIDDETRNRFLILTTPESEEQTRRVMRSMLFGYTREGHLFEKEREKILRKYKVIQKILRPLTVLFPLEWLEKLEFSAERIAYKRRFRGYLSLIASIALHRQFQREVRVEDGISFIDVEKPDIEDANILMNALYENESPDLSPVNQKMILDIERFCKDRAKETQMQYFEIPFSRRDLREFCGWEETPCRRAFEALEQLEFIRRSYGVEGRARWYYKLSAPLEEMGSGLKLWTP